MNEGHPGRIGLADHAESVRWDEGGGEIGEWRVAARQRSRTRSGGVVIHSVGLIRVLVPTLGYLHRLYDITIITVSARFS